jgi:glycosyltransferase involved in cell wall biosynthesis
MGATASIASVVSIVTPFFNEEDVIARYFAAMSQLGSVVPGIRFEFVCVNDGSNDATLERLIDAARHDPRIHIIDLSRNFGKEAALTAGLDRASGDAVVPLDADLQDPPELIPEFIARWRAGAEVVIAKRSDRSAEGFLKRRTAALFYRIHNRIADEPIPPDVGDFRLMDRRAVEALRRLPERRRFMKGLFAWVGFRVETIEYARLPRVAGTSKFSGWRLWNFALEGITSFSTVPLRVWTYFGLTVSFLAFLYAAFIIVRTLVFGVDVPGYASLLAVMLFLGGVQLIGIGVLGEYIGRIYTEAKQRPIYVVRRTYRFDDVAAPAHCGASESPGH